MSTLNDALASTRAADRRKAARALLRRPLLRPVGREADLFVLVTTHERELREWFDRETGWRLTVTPDAARLFKLAADADSTYPATDPTKRVPFSRRRYVLTCLALAVLERADHQITLGRLAEQVVVAAADPQLIAAGVEFALDRRDERTDLVAVVRLLLDWGVLERVSGDEQSFLGAGGDVLYDVRRRTLSVLLTSTRGPSTMLDATDRCAALTYETPPTTTDLRNRRMRHQLTRALLDTPVLYYDRLAEEERAYLVGQRVSICRRITEFTGLIAESRAEGIAMVDPFDDLTDVRMPEVGTDGHATLLIAERLGTSIGTPVPVAELREVIRSRADEFIRQRVWRASAAGGEAELVDTALHKLRALSLIAWSGDEIVALPAIARYGLAEPTVTSREIR